MYVKHFFSLPQKFKDSYKDREPDWGYGEYSRFVFYRTYSRNVEGYQETFTDVLNRTIEGCMSIRKDWYIKQRINWDEEYWTKLAQEMYESAFRMEWLPAGRGLWLMGTQFIYERGSMGLNNCFSGDTLFLNDNKLCQLKDYVGKKVKVNTVNGFKEATVKSFGEQQLYHVMFKPLKGKSLYRIDYLATRNHRWLLSNGTITDSLRKGDKVTISPGKIEIKTLDYFNGLTHGVVFADGCNFYNDNYYVQLCGKKEAYRKILEESKWYSHTIMTQRRMIFKSKVKLKELPDEDTSLEYKQGFIDGWKLFDGCDNGDTCTLDTVNSGGVDWLKLYSGILNYVVVGHNETNKPTNFGERTSPLHRVKLRFEPVEFIVDHIVPSLKKENVYCVVEPETTTFQLAHGIITGNCAFVKLNIGNDFHFMMDCLMLGVGVGFEPTEEPIKFVTNYGEYDHLIPDSREGWCDSVKALYDYYTVPGAKRPKFIYDEIRPAGLPIRGFGGVSSGPEHLVQLHLRMCDYLESGDDSVRVKTDIANHIGFTVVAGNVRRSAELCKGKITNDTFLNLKNYERYPERGMIGGMSNNTCFLYEDEDFDKIGNTVELIKVRGEPGFANLRNFKYGRLGYKHEQQNDKADGLNPCGESTLEDKELCNQAETMPTRCPTPSYWAQKACKYATIYASTVSLLPTHRPESNAVIARNRRITVGFMDYFHWKKQEYLHTITKYMREGYHTIRETNTFYNKQAGVPPAIKVTTIKPGGTTPKLPGCIGGIGGPTFRYTLRRTRVAADSRVAVLLKEAGVPWEPCVLQPTNTHIFEFPIEQTTHDPEMSIWEQLTNIIHVQDNFADNAVSNTLYFKPKWEYDHSVDSIEDIWKSQKSLTNFDDFMIAKESFLIDHSEEVTVNDFKFKLNEDKVDVYKYNVDHEEDVLENVVAFGIGRTKSLSLLPHTKKGAYAQMPEEGITLEEFEYRKSQIKPINWSRLNEMGIGTHFCDSDQCERAV